MMEYYGIYLVILVLQSTAGECCFGFNCAYTSHCKDTVYNTTTGACGQCMTGWSGSNCQQENVALSKDIFLDVPTTTDSQNISFIVDGNTQQDQCIDKSGKLQATFLEVNLVDIYNIKDVKIYYKTNALDTFRGFSVHLTDKLNGNETVCYKHEPGKEISDIETIPCNKRGQYVIIRNSRDTTNPLDYSQFVDLEICEIQVFVCSKNSFGENCEGLCYCYGNDTCDAVTGLCPGSKRVKCKEGWHGNRCEQGCDSKYGDNCDKSCLDRYCSGSSSCNTFDGYCDAGCSPGYIAQDCITECGTGFYGNNCSFRCDIGKQCKGDMCDHVTGECTNGCDPGWKDVNCDLECLSGTFGENCNEQCHCYENADCNSVTGVCPGDGRLKCEDNWTGDRCEQSCAFKYGASCDKSCLDRNCNGLSSCNTFDGYCDAGCSPGYKGNDCMEVCITGFHGNNCSLKCGKNCNDDTCDHVTGLCTNGCHPGRQGPSCDEECDPGFYGSGCNFRCDDGKHCRSDVCHHRTGACTHGCDSGWRDVNCDSKCLSETFGENCNQQCHCHGNDDCDPVTGVCPGDGRLECDDGWTGHRCDQNCDSKYGASCDKSCLDRNCNGLSSCNTFDGSCDAGCSPGYQGSECIQVCDVGYYGYGCVYNCSDRQCENATSCESISGSCDGNCIDGWSGVDCLQECQVNFYGFNCSYDCLERHCLENSTCNTNDGACESGCYPGYLEVDCTIPESTVGAQVNPGLDRVYVGLIGAVCGIILCVLIIIILYCLCKSRWKRLLIVNSKKKEPLYDDIRDVPPEIAISNNTYEEPDAIIRGNNIATFHAANRPLPQIVIDDTKYNDIDMNHQPYVNTVETTPPAPYESTLYSEPIFNHSNDNIDTRSISTLSSCCSDKLQHEQDEVTRATSNIREKVENEYVKMGTASGGRTNGDEEGYVNPNYINSASP